MKRVKVIGGGLSGLAAAYYILEEARTRGIDVDLHLWEEADHFGGKIGTGSAEGFLFETGPNGFLDNSPPTLDLVKRLGLEGDLLRSSDAARRRFLYSGGSLRSLPESPPAFMRSNLLTLRGRLRIIGEYFVPRRSGAADGEDETVASFIRRRLGEEALQKLIDPMASGIYAGDPERMSMASCFPRVVALEKTYGGLIRGMLGKKKEARAAGGKGPSGAGPGGTLTSFKNGLVTLIDALAGAIGDGSRASSPVAGLSLKPGTSDDTYEIKLKSGEKVEAEAVVLATPAYAASAILADLSRPAATLLEEIPYSAMAVVHFGYRRSEVTNPLDGFGFLIPYREKRRILGSLWSSSIFSHRAPEGSVLLTNMLGGARDPDTPLSPDDALFALVREELERIMNQTSAPVFSKAIRWKKAIPQYLPGHEARLGRIEGELKRHRGLFLAGNAYRGIGVNDCIKRGVEIAPKVMDYLSEKGK